MIRITLLFLLISQSITALPFPSSNENNERQLQKEEQAPSNTESSPDDILKQHLASLDTFSGFYLGIGLCSGCVAVLAFVCEQNKIAQGLAITTAAAFVGAGYYNNQKNTLIMQHCAMNQKK